MEFLNINSNNYIEIYNKLSSLSEYKRSFIKIKFVCPICKKEKEYKSNILFSRDYGFDNLICGNCKQGKSLSKLINENKEEWVNRWHDAIKAKFGVDNVAFIKEIQDKKKETCKYLYGNEYAIASPEVRFKIKNIFKEKYNGESPFCSKEIQEKAEISQRSKRGGMWDSQTEEGKLKRKESCLLKYGLPCADSPEIREKARKTNFERYGVEETFKRPEFRDLRKQSMLNKYGVEYYTQDPNWKETVEQSYYNNTGRKGYQKGYFLDNYNFDSSYELSFYIWLRDHKIDFEVHPKISLQYRDSNNNLHYYKPDFKIKNKLFEIKGSQFFNEKNEPVGLYGDWTDKFNCIIQNNVVILREKDLKNCFKYIKEHYGNSFIKSCKNNKKIEN